jgi:hypothetical protein
MQVDYGRNNHNKIYMKNLIKILCVAILFASCSKKDSSLTVNHERKMVMVDERGIFPVNPNQQKRGERRPSYSVTATAMSSSFDGSARVSLSFKVQGRPTVISRRKVGETAQVIYSTNNKITQYTDATAQASTSYVYIVNGVQSNQVTTKDAPIVGGNETSNVIYLNFHGGRVTGWGPWTSYVGGSGMDQWEMDSTLNVYNRELVQKYGLNVTFTLDSNVYNATHYTKRQQAMYTEDNEWFGNQAGGVAYVNSFGQELVCFIFTKLLSYRVDYIIFAGGHEIMHTLGLYHAVDFVGQSYSSGPNWTGAGYNYTPEQRELNESQLSNTDQGYMLVNQIHKIKSILL